MKVLFVTADTLPNYFQVFLDTFRYCIGTCDHLKLTGETPEANARIIESQRTVLQYDRSVFFAQDNPHLREELDYFEDFQELTILRLERETQETQIIFETFFRNNPWVRWIGTDNNAFNRYRALGVDVHQVKSIAFQQFKGYRVQEGGHQVCYVAGILSVRQAGQLNAAGLRLRQVPREIHLNYLEQRIESGDLFLFLDAQMATFSVLNYLMEKGAIVVTTQAVAQANAHLSGMGTGALIVLERLEDLAELSQHLASPGVREQYAAKSLAVAGCVSPKQVAADVARLVSCRGRERENFVQPRWTRIKLW